MTRYNLKYDIIFPVLNEETRLPNGIEKIIDFLKSIEMENFSITIADNGSVDRTKTVADALAAKNPKIKSISVGKKGLGLALKTAWNQSDADVVGYMDVDLATDLTHFQEVVYFFETNNGDFINGSRNLASSIVKNRSPIRTLTSIGYNKILQAFLNVNFTDGMCGFKFLRNSVYRRLSNLGAKNDGLFFCTELLYFAEKNGIFIQEIPVRWTDDRDSRVKLIKTIFYYLREIFMLLFKIKRRNKD